MIKINKKSLDQYCEKIDLQEPNQKTISVEQFTKLNNFIIELFTDERIPNEVKNEYAEKYNKLKIKVYQEVKNYNIINQ